MRTRVRARHQPSPSPLLPGRAALTLPELSVFQMKSRSFSSDTSWPSSFCRLVSQSSTSCGRGKWKRG